MGIRRVNTRYTKSAKREDLLRKSKARHPLLAFGSRHYEIWSTIVTLGNKRGGMTAKEIKRADPNHYHPQIMKDLIDHRLVAGHTKRGSEYVYIADPNGRGTYAQSVSVKVELFEDDEGYLFTKTTIEGRKGDPGRIVRKLSERMVHFTIPLPEEPGVEKVVSTVPIDGPDGLSRTEGSGNTRLMTSMDHFEVEDTLQIEGDYRILDE